MHIDFKFLTVRSAFAVACIATLAMTHVAQAQTNLPNAPSADTVKALLAANKNGGVELTLSLIATLEENPALVEPLITASDGASQPMLATISAAVSQVMAMMADSNPAAVARMKSAIDTHGSSLLRKEIAANFAEASIATASGGSKMTMASANM